MTLCFSAVNGDTYGPWDFSPNIRVKAIEQHLEEKAFSSRCFDKEANKSLALVEILTSCGVVLDSSHRLNEYPLKDGDTLTVVVTKFESSDDQEILVYPFGSVGLGLDPQPDI